MPATHHHDPVTSMTGTVDETAAREILRCLLDDGWLLVRRDFPPPPTDGCGQRVLAITHLVGEAR